MTIAAVDLSKPVQIKQGVARDDWNHYVGQVGEVYAISRATVTANATTRHVMVFWPGLSCSSMWRVDDLENVSVRKSRKRQYGCVVVFKLGADPATIRSRVQSLVDSGLAEPITIHKFDPDERPVWYIP